MSQLVRLDRTVRGRDPHPPFGHPLPRERGKRDTALRKNNTSKQVVIVRPGERISPKLILQLEIALFPHVLGVLYQFSTGGLE